MESENLNLKRQKLTSQQENLYQAKKDANSIFDELEEKTNWLKRQTNFPEVYNPILNSFKQERSDVQTDLVKQIEDTEQEIDNINREINKKDE